MFGLMTASIYTMAEAGFILGMGILIDTFVVRTITVPALAAMIRQKNWWPSHLGQSAAQVYAAHRRKQQQLDQLADQLVRMKVIPDVRRQTLAPASATPGSTADDLLVRLKLVPPRKKRTSIATTASDSRPIAKGKPSVDRVRAHSLPLFDLSGVQHPLTKEVSESAMDSSSSGNGNGKRKSDRDLGHSLPLFGHDILSSRPILVGANGNGHSDGNRHREQSAEDDFSNPLPLFGANVASSQATNGNGNH